MRILLAEDDPVLAAQLADELSGAGYVVDAAANGVDAHHLGEVEPVDAVVLDLGLPQMDGITVLKRWRAAGRDMPVLILTARDSWHEKVDGIDAGADDYLTKPFNSKELLARVKAVLRRTSRNEEVAASLLTCGSLTIDLARRTVSVNGNPVSLTRTEFELLRCLALNPNRVIPHEELLTEVWGHEYRNDLDYLRAYIRYLRRKLEPDAASPTYILTTQGVGYMLACPE